MDANLLAATQALLDLIDVAADSVGALQACAIDMRSQRRIKSAEKVQQRADALERAVVRAAHVVRTQSIADART